MPTPLPAQLSFEDLEFEVSDVLDYFSTSEENPDVVDEAILHMDFVLERVDGPDGDIGFTLRLTPEDGDTRGLSEGDVILELQARWRQQRFRWK